MDIGELLSIDILLIGIHSFFKSYLFIV